MAESDEREVFEQARAGDRAAFDALHAMYEQTIYRYVRRLVGETWDAWDITQSVFLTLYRHLRKLESPERLLPFLYRVARNRCYDLLRRQGRFPHVRYDESEEIAYETVVPAVDTSELPDEAAHYAVLHRRIQLAIDRLPERQRQALILYAEEDLTYDQIAEVTRCDIGSVKSRIHNGRENLRKLLGPAFQRELGIEKENDDG